MNGLAAAVETFEAAEIDRTSRCAWAAARSKSWRRSRRCRRIGPLSASLPTSSARSNMLAREEQRLVDRGRDETLLVDRPARLKRICGWRAWSSRLGRAEAAEAHLIRVAGLTGHAPAFSRRYSSRTCTNGRPACRRHRRLRRGSAELTRAQTPGIGLARLRALSGAHQEARAALAGVHLERPANAPDAPIPGWDKSAPRPAAAFWHRRDAGELRGRAVIGATLALSLGVAGDRAAAVPRERRRRAHRSAGPGQGADRSRGWAPATSPSPTTACAQ